MTDQVNKRIGNKGLRGQNVIEYLLLTVAVVLVVFAFLNPRGGPGKDALDNILNDTIGDITNLNSELKF